MTRYCAALVIACALAACGSDPAAGDLTIPAIQGSEDTSPYAGRQVTVSGIVTGDFQDGDADGRRNLGGFFMQDAVGDDDPATSDGIFVFGRGRNVADVDVGDRVRVSGLVQEHFGETQIVAEAVTIAGSGAVSPEAVTLPAAGVSINADGMPVADLERFEGMLIRISQRLVVTDLYEFGRFGAVRLAAGERLYQYTNEHRPDVDGYRAHVRDNARRTIMLDDGLRDTRQAPPAWHSDDAPVRAGDTVLEPVGNLRFSRASGGEGREDWRLMPQAAPDIERSNPRPGAPRPGGSLIVATANLSNTFSGIDTGRPACGPRGASGCRGADSVTEQRRQLAKIATALALIDADVLALVELENDRGAAIAGVTRALNERLGSERYAYVDTGMVGDDAIRVGMIYDTTRVAPFGPHAVLDASVDPRFDDNRNRPAVAQTYRTLDDGAVLTVVVNHLKSKGSACDSDGDPNVGDGQANCARTRTRAAVALAEWLAGDPTGSGDPDVLITGDLNAYIEEDPIVALESAGYVNLLEPAYRSPYTFLHRGEAGALDHALASPSLAAQLAGIVAWHVNADEPAYLDYNLENGRNPALFDGDTPYRFGDHDPVVVGFDPGRP